ncbi:Fe(3+) ABC transporter substrate-binding protein [Altererythrobacter sp. H2]|uniref:Fe(3+) ABC transporter substrate-binding protein n=1 Tax=Altererythrobacter sp. H2 TaxID=3108391 RepID=UPI002B4BD477|nr:Fe(3+) ABC transporter substrate-binding protein [Altererythrobacter sp. H2]WRK96549.1 Fe(3+) ABC transporter substrate-binding protein [Altererythrobacter sp. H2]
MFKRTTLSLALASLAVAGCSGQAEGDGADQVVNLYTARHYDSDLALYEQFTQETGIKINWIEGKPDELVARMKAEGANSPADLFITADAGALWRAQREGLFQSVTTDTLTARIPANLREPEGNWYGFTRRARVVAYDPAKVKPEEIDDYADLADPRFKGRICVRSSDSVYNLSLVGALIEAWGPDKAGDWVKGVVANMARPPEGGDRDQIRAVAAGVCDVAITNSYYYIRMASGEDAADRAITDKVKLAFPSIDGAGTHINISGGGVIRNAPNKANAIKLLEFFASAKAQTHISAENNEYPASPDVPAPAPVDAYAAFTAHPMGVAAFAARQPEAQSLMSAAGWR